MKTSAPFIASARDPLIFRRVSDLRDIFLGRVKIGSIKAYGAFAIAEYDIFGSKAQKELRYGGARRSCAAHGDLNLGEALAYHLQGVDEGGGGDDGCSVLIVVKDRYLKIFLQLLLHLEASWGAYVLQVDAPKDGLYPR